MLVLSRKTGESIYIVNRKTHEVVAKILLAEVDRNKVKLGLAADVDTFGIFREEILPSEYRKI